MRRTTTSKQRWDHRSKHRQQPSRKPEPRQDHNRSIVRNPNPPTEAEHYQCFEQPEYLAQLAKAVDERLVP